MGKPGAKHQDKESAQSLRELATILENVANELRAVAERMDRKRLWSIEVLHSRGVKAAARKLKAFAVDADKKAAIDGA
jgi:hypothetical protein